MTEVEANGILGDWQARVRAAAQAGTALRLHGSGSKDFYGESPQGEALDTRAYRGIVAYEPTELVITARCGTPLSEVESAMRGQGQMLAFEPPHFGPGATIGGCVAAGLSGPRRPYAGSVRDIVLGTRVIDGAGEDLRFGGQVMKNVAGFDVSRLLTGSLGTLALITEVSLKCLPLPKAEATRAFELDQAVAIRRINEWAGQPLPISGSAWASGRLWVRFSGAAAAVAAAVGRLGGEAVADEGELWTSLREQTHGFFAAPGALWRVSVAPTAPVDLPGGAPLLEWGGALRWLHAEPDAADAIRSWARRHGGHATLFRGGDGRVGVFQPLAPAIAALHRRLKQALDPQGIFNPGRMYRDL